MYLVELSIKLSPLPISVQRKELEGAQALYHEIRQVIESGQPRLLELICEKEEEKRITLLTSEIVAVQLSEKSSGGGGGRKGPGFSFEG